MTNHEWKWGIMDNNRKGGNLNSKKEALKFAVLFSIIGLIWVFIKRQYLIQSNCDIAYYNKVSFRLNSIFITGISILVYILAYRRIERIRIINNELIASIKETAVVQEEKQFYEISLGNQLFMTKNFVREIDLGVIGWDRDQKITSVNPYFLKLTQYEKEDLLTRNIEDIIIDGGRSFNSFLGKDKPKKHNIKIRGKSDEILDFYTYNMPVENVEGEISKILTFAVDMTEKNKLEKKLRHLAYYDDLTGLPNKHMLRKYLEGQFNEKEPRLAILHIEIDNYKLTIESLKYDEWETLLKKVANIIYIGQMENDYLARTNKNEFVMVVKDNVDKEYLEGKSQDILNKILKPICINGSIIHLSANIGISIYPYISHSPEELLQDAHLALHHIRPDCEEDYAFFDQIIADKINKENDIIKELDQSIEEEDFIPYFQPISYIENNRVLALEVLIRWIHPERGFVSPGEFIPISERTGQIHRITDIILEKALKQKQIWNKKGYKDLKISVNISSKSFGKDDFQLEILELLKKYEIQPKELILEITETAAVRHEDISKALKNFNRFKSIGIEIALDDFGTGNSSLARLSKLPIEYLKLDAEFIKNIQVNKEEREIVKSVIQLAQNLKLLIIAEGIETLDQCKSLLDMGCIVGQGYYLGRPGPAKEIEKMFE